MVNDTIDTALDSDDIEEETEEKVDKVLSEIAGETAAQLPEAVRKERSRVPAQRASTSQQVCLTTLLTFLVSLHGFVENPTATKVHHNFVGTSYRRRCR